MDWENGEKMKMESGKKIMRKDMDNYVVVSRKRERETATGRDRGRQGKRWGADGLLFCPGVSHSLFLVQGTARKLLLWTKRGLRRKRRSEKERENSKELVGNSSSGHGGSGSDGRDFGVWSLLPSLCVLESFSQALYFQSSDLCVFQGVSVGYSSPPPHTQLSVHHIRDTTSEPIPTPRIAL